MDGNNNTFAQAGNDSGLHLNPAEEAGLTEQQIESPQSSEEYYLDSMSAILRANIGQPVTCEFLVGTNNIIRRDGILYSSGVNFLTLYQPNDGRYVVCDIFSLRFITFYDMAGRPASTTRNVSNAPRSANNQPNLQNGAGIMQGGVPGASSPMMGNQMPGMAGGMPRGTRGGY